MNAAGSSGNHTADDEFGSSSRSNHVIRTAAGCRSGRADSRIADSISANLALKTSGVISSPSFSGSWLMVTHVSNPSAGTLSRNVIHCSNVGSPFTEMKRARTPVSTANASTSANVLGKSGENRRAIVIGWPTAASNAVVASSHVCITPFTSTRSTAAPDQQLRPVLCSSREGGGGVDASRVDHDLIDLGRLEQQHPPWAQRGGRKLAVGSGEVGGTGGDVSGPEHAADRVVVVAGLDDVRLGAAIVGERGIRHHHPHSEQGEDDDDEGCREVRVAGEFMGMPAGCYWRVGRRGRRSAAGTTQDMSGYVAPLLLIPLMSSVVNRRSAPTGAAPQVQVAAGR